MMATQSGMDDNKDNKKDKHQMSIHGNINNGKARQSTYFFPLSSRSASSHDKILSLLSSSSLQQPADFYHAQQKWVA
eukprot:3161300-Ditylum_brightwellii.AAC.1